MLISLQHPEKDLEKGEESWDALYCKGQVDSVSEQCQEAATVVGGRKEEEKERQVVVGRLPACEEENKKTGLDLRNTEGQ